MPSYQVGDTCYPSLALATSAYVARYQSSTDTIGTNCTGFMTLGFNSTPGQVVFTWTRTSGTCTVPATTTLNMVFPECAMYSTADAAIMSWGVAGCWIAVFAVAVILKRALQ